MLPYGNEFYKSRKLFQEYLSRQACTNFRDMQLNQAQAVHKKLLGTPDKFISHISR